MTVPSQPAAAEDEDERTVAAGDATSPSVQRSSRRMSDARSALIGGLAAALISSLIGYFGVAAQIRAEDERSSSEFLRTQRQELYARYLTNETQLERLEIDFLQMVRNGGSGSI
jgi:hypothetical protein